jgi:monoamine oxidase
MFMENKCIASLLQNTHNWFPHPYFAGAFSMFKPEQETELRPFITSSEGRVHFADEHTSNFRSRIQEQSNPAYESQWK